MFDDKEFDKQYQYSIKFKDQNGGGIKYTTDVAKDHLIFSTSEANIIGVVKRQS